MEIYIIDKSLRKFIKSLEKSTIAKTLRTIDLLEKFRNKLELPHSKKIKGNFYELRIRGIQEVRIFYTFHKSKIFLLHGFIKKSTKTPLKEIHKAVKKLKKIDFL